MMSLPPCLPGLLACLPAGFIVRPLGRRTRHPTQAHIWGDNGRQEEARPREGGRTTQAHIWGDNGRQEEARPREEGGRTTQAHIYGETMGDKRRQDLGKADAQHRHSCGETMGDKG